MANGAYIIVATWRTLEAFIMYLPFLMLGYSGALFVLLIGCRLARTAIPTLAIRELTWAVVAAIVAVVLVGLRPWVWEFVSVFVGNSALLVCYLLLYGAAANVLSEGRRTASWLSAFCLAALVPFLRYTFWSPDTAIRIFIISGALATESAVTAVLLFAHRSSALKSSTRVVAAVQVLSAIVLAARATVSILHGPQNFVTGDWIQTGFTYLQLITFLSTGCGILWLAICKFQSELEQMAMTDGLTGLLNRRAFDDVLSREILRSRITGREIGLMLFDIDHFKMVNDTYGHAAGDLAIRRTGEILRFAIRPEDSLARYGGEEFAILARRTGPEQLAIIAERVRLALEQADFGDRGICLTASVGLTLSDGRELPAELMERCDKALYHSKKMGRNRVTFLAASVNEGEVQTPVGAQH